ncbi:hypothetical protein [Streptomyces sp. NPDC054842]
MRLCTSLPLTVAATAVLCCGPVPAAAGVGAPAPVPGADRRPSCAEPDARAFPLTTRIHGGPDVYETGGAEGTWSIDLTNKTAHPCGNLHPVVILVDAERRLRPSEVRLEFFEGTRAHPVSLVRTDDDELVGVFGGFPGFTVAPGRTLSVKVRLTVTSAAAAPNDVVANAALVRRHSDDGDWVGQSNDYRFRITGGPDRPEKGRTDAPEDGGTETTGPKATTPPPSAEPSAPGTGTDAEAAASAGATTGSDAPDDVPAAEELASTGSGAWRGTWLLIGALLLTTGSTLLLASRRLLRGGR